MAWLGVWVTGVCALWWTGDLSSCLSPSDCWEKTPALQRLRLCHRDSRRERFTAVPPTAGVLIQTRTHWTREDDKNHRLQKSSASASALASLWGRRCRCLPLNDEGAADGKHLSSCAVIGVVRHPPFSCLWFRVDLRVLQPGFHPSVKWVCRSELG